MFKGLIELRKRDREPEDQSLVVDNDRGEESNKYS